MTAVKPTVFCSIACKYFYVEFKTKLLEQTVVKLYRSSSENVIESDFWLSRESKSHP